MILPRGKRIPNRRSRNDRWRGSVSPARFAAVTLGLPETPPASARRNRAPWLLSWLAGGLLAAAGIGLHGEETPVAPAAEEIFVLENLPPPPPPADPSPQPAPSEVAPAEAPPPQFGLREEALGESGDMAVATGNTLMTEADSVVKAPVAALPATPPLMDQAPRILKGRAPEYPQRALERGLEASLTVLITIDTLGRVTQVEVEKSGGRDFDPEVERSVRQIVFQPPIRDGKRVTARFRQQYEFRLE
jgi:TonB family protein